MSGTGKRGPDLLNVIGIVTVGVCGAVLTYVSIVLLTAYYMHETTDRDHQKAIENPSALRETVHASTTANLDGSKEGTIKVERAVELVLQDAAKDPSNLVPAVGPSTQPTVVAEYGRAADVQKAAAPTPPATEPAKTEPAPTAPTGTEPAKTEPAPVPTGTEPAKTEPAKPAEQTPPATTPPAPTGAKPAPKPAPKKPAPKKPAPTGTQPAPGGNAP